MSLLTICDDVLAEIGLVMPPRLVGNADPTARRIFACAKAEGEYLYRCHDWAILQREHTFETTAGERNYPVPDDFGRIAIRTAYDRTSYWRMRGSLTPQQWQHQRSALVASVGLMRHFRVLVGPLAGSILLDPVPASTGADLVYEYTSRFWCEDSAGNGQGEWLADTDEFRLDHELFKLGLLWRVKRANGQAYEDERNDAEIAVRKAKVADFAMEPFCLNRGQQSLLPNIPEGSWPTG